MGVWSQAMVDWKSLAHGRAEPFHISHIAGLNANTEYCKLEKGPGYRGFTCIYLRCDST